MASWEFHIAHAQAVLDSVEDGPPCGTSAGGRLVHGANEIEERRRPERLSAIAQPGLPCIMSISRRGAGGRELEVAVSSLVGVVGTARREGCEEVISTAASGRTRRTSDAVTPRGSACRAGTPSCFCGADLLGELDDASFRPADVAEPIEIQIVHDVADRVEAPCPQSVHDGVQVPDGIGDVPAWSSGC